MTKKICRICLKNDSILYNIFDVCIMDEGNSFTVSDVLSSYCFIKVDRQIPQSICTNCIEVCTNTFSFIKLVQKNDSIFNHLARQKDFVVLEIKEEASVKLEDPLSDPEPLFSIENNELSTNKVDFVCKKELDLEILKNTPNSSSEHKSHKCPICKKLIMYYPRFAEHLKLHPHAITCDLCAETFQDNVQFERHYFQNHFNYCDICQKSFITRKRYVYHRSTVHEELVKHKANWKRNPPKIKRSNINVHKCSICNKSFLQKSKLVAHTQKMHEDKPATCIKKGKERVKKKKAKTESNRAIFSTGMRSNAVMKRMKGYRHICPICTSPIQYLARFRIHIRNSHVENPDNTAVNCSYCENVFQNTEDFYSHYISEHYIKCRACKTFFTNKSILEGHECCPPPERKQPPNKTTHICPICGKRYKGSKRMHEETHRNQANYKCDMCELTFIGYHQLRYHRVKKHNLMKHLCPYCGQRFVNKTKMTTHMWVHTGIKAYSCEDCGKRFSNSGSLKNHKMKAFCEKETLLKVPIECDSND